VPLSDGGSVIIVRAPRGFIPPHRVIARESNRFWARAGTTKYQPNVEQLRRQFNDAPHLAERIRLFADISSFANALCSDFIERDILHRHFFQNSSV
jgi:hypothetical protein